MPRDWTPMSKSLQRSWLQIHLSTAILLLVALAALLYSNVRLRDLGVLKQGNFEEIFYTRTFEAGWPRRWVWGHVKISGVDSWHEDEEHPFICEMVKDPRAVDIPVLDTNPPNLSAFLSDTTHFLGSPFYDWPALLIDIAVGLLICGFQVFVCEYFIRRREARKH